MIPEAAGVPRRGGRLATFLLWGAIAFFVLLVIWKAWVSDDAYITLRTADNFLHGHGLRWNVDERVQAYTHPLWMMVLTAAVALTGEHFVTTMAVGVLTSLAVVLLLAWRVVPCRWSALLGIGLLCFSRACTDYATSGLENPLTHLLLLVHLVTLFGPASGTRRTFRLHLTASLVALTRMDALLLVLPGLLVDTWRRRRGVQWRTIVVAWSPFLLWEVFSLLYYGFPLPNTAYAKLQTGMPLGALLAQGAWYCLTTILDDPLTLVVIPVALWRGLASDDSRARMAAVGVALYLMYLFRIGGDFMSGRFFTAPMLVAVVVLLQVGIATRRARLLWCGVLGILSLTPMAPYRGVHPREALPYDVWGVADERVVYDECCSLCGRRGEGPWPNPKVQGEARSLRSNWDRDAFVLQLKKSGLVHPDDGFPAGMDALNAAGRVQPVVLRGAIGYLGFYLGPSVHVLDYHALGEPLLARLPAEKRDPLTIKMVEAWGVKGWRIGHFIRKIPRGYFATLVSGENHIEDPDLARFYDQVKLVTRGPVWSWRRLVAVAEFNAGVHDKLVERYTARKEASAAGP